MAKPNQKRALRRTYFVVLFVLCLVTFVRGYRLKHSGRVRESEHLVAEDTATGGTHLGIDNAQSDLEQTRQMEHSILRFMEQWEIQGASLAIMKEGKLIYSKGFGWADREKQTPVEVNNIFRIASLSKLITATGIMKLQEQGRLALSDPVFGPGGILNDPKFLDIKDKRVEKITVEQLLRHQSGFSIRGGDPLFNLPTVAQQLGVDRPLTLDDLVRYASQTRLRYEPGSSNIYSNLGYVVLAKVIEQVSGQHYEQFMRDSILIPIGCYDMHLGHADPAERLPNEVHYYEPSDAEMTPSYDGSGRMVPKSYGGTDLQLLSGAGGWVASPTELMRFIAAIDPDNPRPNVLGAKTIAYMIEREAMPGSGTAVAAKAGGKTKAKSASSAKRGGKAKVRAAAKPDKKPESFPIGWMRTTDDDDWSRTGTLAGSSAMLKRQHDGYTWVFVTNTSSWSGSKFPRKIDAMIRQALSEVESWPERDLFDKGQ